MSGFVYSLCAFLRAFLRANILFILSLFLLLLLFLYRCLKSTFHLFAVKLFTMDWQIEKRKVRAGEVRILFSQSHATPVPPPPYTPYTGPLFGCLSWEGDFSVVKKIPTTIERRQSGCEALSVSRSPYPVNLNCLANNNNNKK